MHSKHTYTCVYAQTWHVQVNVCTHVYPNTHVHTHAQQSEALPTPRGH